MKEVSYFVILPVHHGAIFNDHWLVRRSGGKSEKNDSGDIITKWKAHGVLNRSLDLKIWQFILLLSEHIFYCSVIIIIVKYKK